MYSYVVKGSEDGVIGVFTSRKKAVECGVNYTTQYDSADDFCAVRKLSNFYTEVVSDNYTAEIERFFTNYNPVS